MNDKKLVEETQDSFDVLVLQGNLAISAHRGLGSWQKLKKPFWIDPIVYAWVAAPAYLKSEQKVKPGKPETEVRYKRTFCQLAEEFGEPFTTALKDERALKPSDFEPDEDAGVTERVLKWQCEVLDPPEEDQKYLGPQSLEPVLLTVPFFPLKVPKQGESPEWLDVNLRLLRSAVESDYSNDRLAAGLLIDEDLFDREETLNDIVNSYLDLPIDHLWLWISDNEETAMPLHRAIALKRLVERVTERGKFLHQAFGGSFSSMLLSKGLTSVAHGVSYWEHKSWEPLAGGGVPTLRFLLPPLRKRIPFLDADTVVDFLVNDAIEFHEDVCACETCRVVLDGDLKNFAGYGAVETRVRIDRFGNRIEYDVPLPDALWANKSHYLKARAIEVAETTASGFDPVATLNDAFEKLEPQSNVRIRHLETWARAFETDS